ncbi:hydroxypyruvate isomerase family protein [Paracoccus beibuensis]|uniref:hydroxypyruvate isomerase family protein n=1 Tax=Paracoccus beibuensis TaxID=547602 RepID=UPI002240C694|nr:TIM barrel protein [Paracoccus beibuensis]
MTRFSANLGFLWAELPLPDAIAAAGRAGFAAVECHWPYSTPPAEVRAALETPGLPMLGLNTLRGQPGENGLAALPGREDDARAAIDQAIAYAQKIGCGAIHVMAGRAEGPLAEETFLRNLDHACRAAPDMTMLIEPLNHRDAPDYFLTQSDQAAALIERAGHANLRMMFDCYHVQITEGEVARRLRTHLPLIGHVQIASVPDRGAPDHGLLDYGPIYELLDDLNWQRPVGAEYRPIGPTDDTLSWLAAASLR